MSKKRASVKWFNDAKGIGFLTTDKGDVFVHYKNIEPGQGGFKTLKPDQLVDYTPITTSKGLAAAEVVPVGQK